MWRAAMGVLVSIVGMVTGRKPAPLFATEVARIPEQRATTGRDRLRAQAQRDYADALAAAAETAAHHGHSNAATVLQRHASQIRSRAGLANARG